MRHAPIGSRPLASKLATDNNETMPEKNGVVLNCQLLGLFDCVRGQEM